MNDGARKDDARQLFSQTAVDRLASPEHMDDLLSFESLGLWITLLAALGIVAGVVCWGLFGRVTTDVSARGMLLAGSVQTVESLGEGQIQTVLISNGSTVHAGDAVATLLVPQSTEAIAAEQAILADLERQRAALATLSSGQNGLQATSLEQQRGALKVEINTLERQKSLLDAQQATERGLLAKGLITHTEAAATDQSLSSVEATLAAKTAEFSELDSQRYRTLSAGRMESLGLDEQIDAARHRLDALQHGNSRVTTVRSAYTGEVVEVSIRPGMTVHAGTTVAELQSQYDRLKAIVYVRAADAKQIAPGMAAELSPAGFKTEEYGFLRGTVERVSAFPVTGNMLMATLGNDVLTKGIEEAGAVHEVDIALTPVAGSAAHFQWSSPRGQALALTAGTTVSAQIVVRIERPGNLVIPYLRKTMGVR